MKQLVVAGLLSLGLATSAQAYTIDDNYVGADNNGWGDRIGTSTYEVQGIDVSFTGTMMDVRVYTNFTTNWLVDFGDLFISVDGWSPYTTADSNAANGYILDDASNGETWEFVFDTDAGSLYGDDFSIAYSDDKIPAGYTFRNGQEVQRASGGTALAGSSVDLSNTGNGGYVDYSISLAALGLASDAEIGLKWGMTCANDTIEGAVQYKSVPESNSLWLFALGLLGLGAMARRKRF